MFGILVAIGFVVAVGLVCLWWFVMRDRGDAEPARAAPRRARTTDRAAAERSDDSEVEAFGVAESSTDEVVDLTDKGSRVDDDADGTLIPGRQCPNCGRREVQRANGGAHRCRWCAASWELTESEWPDVTLCLWLGEGDARSERLST